MTEDPDGEAETLLPELPDPPPWWELVVTVPGDLEGESLPLAPAGGAVASEVTLRMPLRARTLSEAMILAASLGAWTKVPGARAEVRPA